MSDSKPEVSGGELRKEFSALMREHHQDLLIFTGAVIRDQDAARDIVQEAFLSAWRKFESFEQERDFGAWMRGIVRFKCKDWFRKQQRTPISDTDWIEWEVDLDSWHSEQSEPVEVFEKVDDCLRQLPRQFRDAVQEFYFKERTGEEAATELKISPANFRKRLERARTLLGDCLSKKTNPQPSHSHV